MKAIDKIGDIATAEQAFAEAKKIVAALRGEILAQPRVPEVYRVLLSTWWKQAASGVIGVLLWEWQQQGKAGDIEARRAFFLTPCGYDAVVDRLVPMLLRVGIPIDSATDRTELNTLVWGLRVCFRYCRSLTSPEY